MSANFDAAAGESSSTTKKGSGDTNVTAQNGQPTDSTHPNNGQTNAGDGNHLEGGNGTGGSSSDKLTDEGLLCWTKEAWNDLTSLFKSPEKCDAQTIDSIDSLTFDSVYPTSTTASAAPTATDATASGTTTPKGGATDTQPAPAGSDSSTSGGGGGGIGGFFSDLTKEVGKVVSNPLDWLFSSKDSNGDKTTVAAKDGVATFSGKLEDNKSGTDKPGENLSVNVGVTKDSVSGTAGDLQFVQNKQTKETQLHQGDFVLSAGPDGTTATNTVTGDKFHVDQKTGKYELTDSKGNVIATGTGENDLQKALADGTVTATNQSASTAADDAAKKLNPGDSGSDADPKKTKYFVDHDGNYGIVESNGMVIKTYKDSGTVTISQNGHELRIQNHHVEVMVDGKWQELRHAHGFRLPRGLHVNDDGTVQLNGQQLVDSKGDVKVDNKTTVQTDQGKMTSQSQTEKPVTVQAGNGTTDISENGRPLIHHTKDGYTVDSPETGKPEFSYNCHTHHMQEVAPDGSHVDINTGTGLAVVTDNTGQTTTVGDDGTLFSTDAAGNLLFGIDSNGDVSFFDGTNIDSDGDVRDGDDDDIGSYYGDGTPADSAISTANSAVSTALGIAANGQGSANEAGSLGSIDAALGALAQQYTALGMLDVVSQLQSAQANVEAAKAQIDSQVHAADLTRSLVGTVSPELTREIQTSGISDPTLAAETVLRNHGYNTNSNSNSGSGPAAA